MDDQQPTTDGRGNRTSGRGATLIMLVGPPASGKSYLGRLLARRVGAEVVQTDAIRKAIFRPPRYTGAESAVVYREAHRRVGRELRAGRTVVFDATNLAERARRLVYRIADEAGASLVIAVTYAPPEVIRQRLAGRQRGVDPLDASDADWTIYLKLGRVQPIARPHLVVNTTVDVTQAVELIATRVEQGQTSTRARRAPVVRCSSSRQRA